MDDMVIFTRTFDLLTWLLPHCESLPRAQRFVLVKRLQDAALDTVEALYLANSQSGAQRLTHLRSADARLNALRLYLRLALRMEWLTNGQYAHVSRIVAEIGKLLGGWIKQTRSGAGMAGNGA